MQVQAHKQPKLDSSLRVAQRMEAVFQTVHSRNSKQVRVVIDVPAGSVAKGRIKDSWVEQLAKDVQQLNQQLGQG